MNKGGRPYILEHPPLYAGAVGRNRVLFLSSILFRKVEPAAALTNLPQAWMVALTEAVEIGFGRVAFQSAEYRRNRQTLWGDGVRILTQKLVAKRYMIA